MRVAGSLESDELKEEMRAFVSGILGQALSASGLNQEPSRRCSSVPV